MSDPRRSPQHAAPAARRNNAGTQRLHEALPSGGRPLDAPARAFFEPRFGHDFSRVRVHDGAEAAAAARSLNARAYAVGNDIVLGSQAAGLQRPQQLGLLAHELAHVVQQRSGGHGFAAEPGARSANELLARGYAVPADVVGGAPQGLYRLGTEESPPIPVNPMLLPPSLRAPAAGTRGASPAPAFRAPAGGFQTPHLSDLSPAVPKLPPPNLTATTPRVPGPLAKPNPHTGKEVFPELASKYPNFRVGDDKKPAPGAPETLTVPGSDRLIKTAIRLSPPSPDTKLVDGKIPPAYVTSALQQAFVTAELTGNPPPGVDKGDLLKTVYSIVSTYFLADVTAKMAAAFTSKDKGATIQMEFTLNIPSGGGATTVQRKFSGAGFQALSAGTLGVGGTF